MSLNDKLQASSEESLLEAAEAEVEELSNQSRPMLVSEINEA